MGVIEDGKYHIRLAANPHTVVGADHTGEPVNPVVLGGSDNIWFVTHVKGTPGDYVLLLKQTGTFWLSQNINSRVVVGNMPNTSVWSIGGKGPYTIEIPSFISPTQAWTLDQIDPSSPVTLRFLTVALPSQLWEFIPVYEETE